MGPQEKRVLKEEGVPQEKGYLKRRGYNKVQLRPRVLAPAGEAESSIPDFRAGSAPSSPLLAAAQVLSQAGDSVPGHASPQIFTPSRRTAGARGIPGLTSVPRLLRNGGSLLAYF